MFDYREWCRFCGSLYGNAEIQGDILLMAEILEISTESKKICYVCLDQFTQFHDFVVKAKSLERLFTGLKEENDVDLIPKRLNAYRAHFNLKSVIPETTSDDSNNQPDVDYECIEYRIDDMEYKEEDGILTDTLDEADSSTIVQEEFVVDDEIFIEEEVEDTILEDYLQQPQQRLSIKSRNLITEKTEDEKLFTFSCHICSQEFLKMKLLALHCKEQHNCQPLVRCCSQDCDAVLSTWRRLMIHKENHFPSDENLRCPECQRVYVTLPGFKKHMEKHNIRYVCSHCGKVFKETKTLQWHEQTHLKSLDDRRNHQCSNAECGRKFITKQACENHFRMKHERIINCYCKYPDCNKGFFTKKAYYEHMRNTHTDRKFSCELCSFKAKTKSALNTHKDIHQLGEEYSCDLCDAAFSVYRRLKAHMVCHSNETPYHCEFCDVSFKRSKDLKSHSYVHTKERPFSCQFCTRSFANGANCRKHKLKDHPDELRAWESENGVGGRNKLKCYQ